MKDINIEQIVRIDFRGRKVTNPKTAARYYAREMCERDPAIDRQLEEFLALEEEEYAWRITDEERHDIHYERIRRYEERAFRRLLPIFKKVLEV